ncbi:MULTISPECIES: hypothetical protein [unclassified Streptomyces]|uniref:hypothetical protein n=1 Tax=unclassified Streptomyces TaxID=2593676 RepID=UPI000B29A7FE|nr:MULTISPECIES: hypothetical protein [unclassified Streptomyces]
MTTQPDMLQVALQGFHASRIRYASQLGEGHPEEQMIIPTIEVIYWACVLDEQLELNDAPYGASPDFGREVLLGTRFARNRATHQLPMLIKKRSGLSVPVTVPVRLEEMVWLPVEDLPPGRPAPRQQRHYVQHLAGTPVRHTIDQIASWFAAEQNRQGSLLGKGTASLTEVPHQPNHPS